MEPTNSEQYRFIDLSHTIEHGMITYKGLPAPLICDYWSRAQSKQFYTGDTEFHIGKIEMVANTGTYLDSPFHRYEDGMDLSQLPLLSLANLEGILVQTSNNTKREISHEAFQGIDINGKAVLIHTGWDRYWGTDDYFVGHPYITKEAARFLVDSRAALIGIDSLNIDDTDDGHRPAHTIILDANIPIVEHLCGLEDLPNDGFNFFAVPAKVKGFGSFPVRAFAIINQLNDKDP